MPGGTTGRKRRRSTIAQMVAILAGKVSRSSGSIVPMLLIVMNERTGSIGDEETKVEARDTAVSEVSQLGTKTTWKKEKAITNRTR